MKRSKMIDLMWSYIQKVEYDYDYYMDEENVKELLDLIEKAGMLPPANPKKGFECGECGVDYYEWEDEKKFFRLAERISKKSDHRHQLGAVLVSGNKILGFGFNRNKTSIRRSAHPFNSIHAESDCLANALPQEIIGATMYVYHSLKNGSLANSKPCKFCHEALRQAGVKRICYTVENGYNEEDL